MPEPEQRHVIIHHPNRSNPTIIKHPPGCDQMYCDFYSAYISTLTEPSEDGRFWCIVDSNGDFVQQEPVEDWWADSV
jgi:hypothetical protein